MNKPYLTVSNLSKKSGSWIKDIHFSEHRKKKFNFDIKKSALLVIDMQNFFTDSASHAFVPSSRAIITQINKLINEFRMNNSLVVFTYHAYRSYEDPGIMKDWWNDTLFDDDILSKICSDLMFSSEDILIRKTRYSAFKNTNLEKILQANMIEQIVITGVLTHLCCDTTARDAFMQDYQVFFTVDATATDNEDCHLSTIKNLSDGFVIPVRTDEII